LKTKDTKMINFHDLAMRAHGGDKDAMSVLIIEVPKGTMNGMSPEELVKKMVGDKSMCDKMGEMDHFSKDSYDAYAEEHSEEGPNDLQSDLQGLLDNWTERDPSTVAGQYYEELKEVVERSFGPTEVEGEE
tara:strand:- start:556 stop:948 length:393 start_codon:yes stop_codon:yes gene_type:complete